MTEDTKIEWATHSWSPWIGCTNVSPGCDHCYAETLTKRTGSDVWGPGKERRRTTPAYWRQPYKWAKQTDGERPRVFPSMCDPFDAEVSDAWRLDFFQLIEETPELDWLLLTKRPNLILKSIPLVWKTDPPPNVWYGTSVENQDYAWRLEHLAQVPAVVRFVSYEPALGPLFLLPHYDLDWVIAGGESGGGARPPHLDWFRWMRDQCSSTDTAFFMKQMGRGSWRHPKGGDMSEWPADLRIREFPRVAVSA